MMEVRRLAVLLFSAAILSACGGGQADDEDAGRFFDRELQLPGADYRLSSPEDEMLRHQWELFVDPDKPLSDSLMRDVLADPREAIRRELMEQTREDVEELLFD